MSRETVHCFTSFTFSYLARAKILATTLKSAHPDWMLWAVITDEPPSVAYATPPEGFDRIIYAKTLAFDRFERWMFKHDIVEASTAVKGQMLRYLLDQKASKIVYLDPDIAVFSSLEDIARKLDDFSIILTPHQITPNRSEGLIKDNEMTSLKYGVFNLGFVAVKGDDVGRTFAEWWARQLYFACYDDVPNGLFTDQKWCDLVPCLFDRVHIERDPGYNVASWNISTREIKITREGTILANGSPLKFFHFTKINTAGDIMIEKNARDNVDVMELWNWYKRSLADLSHDIPKVYWHYANFDNGVKIPKPARVLFRERIDLFEYFTNPFATSGDSFFNWLQREKPTLLSAA
jgi:lipopolysaccharide biosynthesis glycosyltransferase